MSSTIDYSLVLQNLIGAGVAPDMAAQTIAQMMTGNAVAAPTKMTKTKTTKTKKPAKETKPREPVPAEHQCCARVWGKDANGPQCAVRKVDGSDYCGFHKKQAADGEEALCWNEDGTKKGLHLGRFDAPMPWRATSGEVCYAEFAPEGAIDALKASGEFKWHPNVKQGRQENGTVAPKKARATKQPKEPKAKKPRGTNAYFLYLKENREQIKADLIAAAAEGEKVGVTAVTKKAGELWAAIKDTDAAAKYHEAAAASKAAAQAAVVEEPAVVEAAAPANTPAAEEVPSADDLLDDLQISTPTEKEVADGIEQAKANGTWVDESAENSGEEEEEGEDAEEFEHDGVTYLKVADGRLFLMNSDGEPEEAGKVEDGKVEIY
jgi:hypothetical protein